MAEVRVWIALELLQSGVSLECITESHQALHLAIFADVVVSKAAVGGARLSVATDDFWAKFGHSGQSGCVSLVLASLNSQDTRQSRKSAG